MDLARLVPAEAIIGEQDGGHAEPAKGIVLDDCFAAGSEKKAPGFGAGHMAMLDEDTGRPVEIFDYVSEAGFPGNRPGEGDEQLSWGEPIGGLDDTKLIDCKRMGVDEGDGVPGIIPHKAIGLGMHIPKDQLMGRAFADDLQVYAVYIYGVVMEAIEAVAPGNAISCES